MKREFLSVGNREPGTATEPPNILFIVSEDNGPGLDWFEEIQSEGGYRAYYAVPGCGSLQGGGTPVGLGMDHEFFESVVVPQVTLYGFLGARPQPDHLLLDPQLPSSWLELTVTRVHYREHVFDLRVDEKSVDVTLRLKGTGPLNIQLPEGNARVIELH